MYMTTIQAAEKWGVTRGRVCHYLWANQIPGALKVGRDWIIPEDCQKPGGYQPNKTGPKPTKAAQPEPPTLTKPEPTTPSLPNQSSPSPVAQSSPSLPNQSTPKIGLNINIVPR